jgi:hypothetical protein
VLFRSKLKEVPIIDKFKKTNPQSNKIKRFFSKNQLSVLARLLNRKPIVPEGTNLIFERRAPSVRSLLKPISLYPESIKKHINSSLIRKTYQLNNDALMAAYTLRKEVFPNE